MNSNASSEFGEGESSRPRGMPGHAGGWPRGVQIWMYLVSPFTVVHIMVESVEGWREMKMGRSPWELDGLERLRWTEASRMKEQ